MAISDIGIKLSLEGVSSVQGGLSQVTSKLGDMDSATLKVGDALKGMGLAAVAALGVGSLAAVTSMVKGYIDAAEGLKDLGIKTGTTVESLSAFASIGKLTGTTAETIGQAMNKLAKNMAGSTEESKGAAAALKALGLDFNAFNAMRPEDKMLALAKAMNQFEDGSAKSAVAMTLMGKSGADLLPFMRDLGNTGELVAKVTAEQAEMADQYNDAMTVAAERTEDLKRSLALGLLPGMIALYDLTQLLGGAIRDYLAGGAAQATGQFDVMRGVIRTVGTVLEALIVLASDVAFVFKSVGREIGGIVAQFSALGEGGGIFSAEGRAGWTRVGEMIKADAQSGREELDRFQASILGMTDRILQQRDALNNHSLSAAENRNELDRLGKQHGVTGQKTLEFSAATKQAKESIDQAAKAGQDYLASLNAQFAAMNQQISLGRELTKTESEILKLEEEVRAGKKKLTDQELESARAKLLEMDAMREQVAQIKEGEKATLAAIAAREKEYAAALQITENLREQVLAQEAANLTAQTGVDYTGQLTVAKLRDAAATADRNAILAMERQENNALADQYRQQAAGLRALADAKEQGIHIKAAQEANAEWGRVTDSINNGLTDALMRAFESGKGFFEAFKSTLVNAFKSMVLQPTIKAILAPVSGAIGSMLGFGNAAASTGAAGSAGAGFGSLLSSGMNFLSGGTINGAALNLVNSGLGQTLGLSSLQNIGGNMIAGPTGLGSMLGSGMGMLGNGFAGYGISKALSGGYSAGGAVNTIAGIASAIPGIGPIAGVVGGLVNRAFGMKAKEMKDAGIEGTISGGDATGKRYQDWFQKGGWFRSNKSGTEFSELGDSLSAALDFGAKGVLEQTKAWAAALKLPAATLSEVTTSFKAKLTGDAAEDQKAIDLIFQTYQDALAGKFEAVIAPFQQAGETIADTMQRLVALSQVSESLNTLGGVFSKIATSSIEARENIIALAGGIENLMAISGQFVADYYTAQEQIGLTAKGLKEQLEAAGVTTAGDLSNKEEFRKLVESVDVSTTQGQELVVTLLQLAPEFARLTEALKTADIEGSLAELADKAPNTAVLDSLLPEAQSTTAAIGDVAEQIKAGNDTLAKIEKAISDGNVSIATGLAALAAATQNVANLQAQVAANTAATASNTGNSATNAALADSSPTYSVDVGANSFQVTYTESAGA
jgi:hypothetical protein